mmetsp:Transcript_13799/g.43177  ORF Transcript_13799/g.43177 Transcript_13799/m.43177 type:complete len:366 (-) Transcript_13799:385-1482(-)
MQRVLEFLRRVHQCHLDALVLQLAEAVQQGLRAREVHAAAAVEVEDGAAAALLLHPHGFHQLRNAEDREEVQRPVQPPDARQPLRGRREARAAAGLALGGLQVVGHLVGAHDAVHLPLAAANRAGLCQVIGRAVRAHDELQLLLVVGEQQPHEPRLVHLPELLGAVELQGDPHGLRGAEGHARRLRLVPVGAAEDEAGGEAHAHALGEAQAQHAQDRGRVRQRVRALHLHRVHDLRRPEHLGAGGEQHRGQRGHGHRRQHGPQRRHAAQERQALQGRRQPRLRAALHVQGAPGDDGGHGHARAAAGGEVRQALAQELLRGVVAEGRGSHPVDGRAGEQGFHRSQCKDQQRGRHQREQLTCHGHPQ